jgi:putative ABC transport system permease protein
MNPLSLALRYVAARPVLNLLTAASIAVGVGLVIATGLLSEGTRASALRNAGGYQLLVAAKGSPVQAVLSTLFFMEPPTGNIPAVLYRELQADQGVSRLVPFNFGDSYRGHFIVATNRDYFALIGDMTGRPPASKPANRWFENPFDAVVGWTVSRELGLKPGSQFTAAHGFIDLPQDLAQEHEGRPYTVVSVLERTDTPADRAIFTPLETSWILHEELGGAGSGRPHSSTQLTALLIQGRGYADLSRLAGALAQRGDVQTIVPARIMTRLLTYLRVGEGVLFGVAWLATGIAFLAVTISLLAAAIERRRQIATLRAIGASRMDVVKVLVGEAGIIAGLGALAGVALGWAAAVVISGQIERSSGLYLDLPTIGLADLATAGAAVLLGMLAGALPASLACREDVARNLAPVS